MARTVTRRQQEPQITEPPAPEEFKLLDVGPEFCKACGEAHHAEMRKPGILLGDPDVADLIWHIVVVGCYGIAERHHPKADEPAFAREAYRLSGHIGQLVACVEHKTRLVDPHQRCSSLAHALIAQGPGRYVVEVSLGGGPLIVRNRVN
jgi:hypothetical protein